MVLLRACYGLPGCARLDHRGTSGTLSPASLSARWDEESLDDLAAGVDERGEDLPSKGWMAIRRLNWPQDVPSPAGVYVSDRVRRGAEEYAARTLRLALHRRTIVTAVLATWPADPRRRTESEWTALRKLLPAGVAGAEIRNRTRQIRAYVAEHGCLPAGLCALEGPPRITGLVLLTAMDRQQVTLQRVDEATARLRVKLPLRSGPATGRDWAARARHPAAGHHHARCDIAHPDPAAHPGREDRRRPAPLPARSRHRVGGPSAS
jgi:hypothetical protein